VQHTLEHLVGLFGPLMTTEEVARVLKFPTVPALRAALRRKRIELTPVDMPGRKQHVFATEDVASCLASWKRKGAASGTDAGAAGEEEAM